MSNTSSSGAPTLLLASGYSRHYASHRVYDCVYAGRAQRFGQLSWTSLLVSGCGGSGSSGSDDDADRSSQDDTEDNVEQDSGQENDPGQDEENEPDPEDTAEEETTPFVYPEVQFIETDAGRVGPEGTLRALRFTGSERANAQARLAPYAIASPFVNCIPGHRSYPAKALSHLLLVG